MLRLKLLIEAISNDTALGIREPGAKNTLLHLGILLNTNDSEMTRTIASTVLIFCGSSESGEDVSRRARHVCHLPVHIAALEDFLQATEIL